MLTLIAAMRKARCRETRSAGLYPTASHQMSATVAHNAARATGMLFARPVLKTIFVRPVSVWAIAPAGTARPKKKMKTTINAWAARSEKIRNTCLVRPGSELDGWSSAGIAASPNRDRQRDVQALMFTYYRSNRVYMLGRLARYQSYRWRPETPRPPLAAPSTATMSAPVMRRPRQHPAEGLPSPLSNPDTRYQDLGADYERRREITRQIRHRVGKTRRARLRSHPRTSRRSGMGL